MTTTRKSDGFIRDMEQAMRPREDIIPGPLLARIFIAPEVRVRRELKRGRRENDEILAGRKQHAGHDSYRAKVFASVLVVAVLWMGVGVVLGMVAA